jgi:hypothetical protein
VLLGLDPVGPHDRPGEQAREARHRVLDVPAHERPRELLRQFRRMAACDVADIEPASEPNESWPTLFPVLEADSAVVLARVEIDVRDTDGCLDVLEVRVDGCIRTALIPTTTIQDLACGLAPELIGDLGDPRDAGGPRVDPDSIEWSEDALRLTFAVTAPLVPGTVTRRSIAITSLAERGWVEEDLYSVTYRPEHRHVVVHLADRPVNELVRLVVRGTGAMPVFGEDPVAPLAGIVGGPPGTVHEGHDAVLSLRNPLIPEADPDTSGAQS